jgi:predicted TIM-barrel fold metal-dependent hydrolase
MADEVVQEDGQKGGNATDDSKPPLSPDDQRAREAVRALAELGALKLCMSCGRDSDRILQPVIYGDDLLNRGPILPLVCADCGHITYYGVDQTLSAATKRTAHG